MNLSEIKTPSDLVKLNQQPNTEFDQSVALLKQVYKLDPAYGKAIAVHILENLLGYHCSMVERNQEAGDLKYALIWQTDAVKIDQAITSIKEVNLLDDNGNEVVIDDI